MLRLNNEPENASIDDVRTAPETQDGVELSLEERGNLLAEDISDEILRLKLDNFEGPFEVLLYLIRSQEIDIFDIPIVKITEQYLRFIDLIREENLDVAGDFLVMAAQLIEIKSKMILPPDVVESEEEEIEEEDPRLELVEKLLEYRRFRDLAILLGDREEARADVFGRRVKIVFDDEPDDEDEYLEVSLYDLIRAIRAILRYLLEPPVHQVMAEGSSVEDKIERILAAIGEKESITWTEIFRECHGRVEIVCCLLAILELCRMRRIRVHQHRAFGDIRIFARQPESGPAPAEAV